MSPDTSIDIGKVNQAMDYMRNVIKKLQDIEDKTQEAVSHVRRGWESSEAAPQFDSLLSQWHSKVPDLLRDTQDILAFLQSAHDDYIKAERDLNRRHIS